MSSRAASSLILTLFLLSFMTGCEEVTAPALDGVGRFSATISGDASRAFAGRAVFTEDVPGPDYGFAIALVDSVDAGPETVVRHAVYLYQDSDGIPAPGEHGIGADEAFGVGVVLDGNGDDPLFCVGETGTLQIIAATSEAVRGTFQVQASCFRLGEGLPGDTILASGTFRAVGGAIAVPDDLPAEPGLQGRYALMAAGGETIPATVFDGIVLVGEDEFIHLEVTVTDGYMEFDRAGAYEHRVSQEVRVDGRPAPALDWVDRGKCVAAGVELTCLSTLVANRAFTTTLRDGALEVTQDLNGEGLAVTYRYVRGG